MNSVTIKNAKLLEGKLKQEILDKFDNFFNQYDLREYLYLLNKYPETTPYNHISPDVKKFYTHVKNNVDSRTLELFHKLILIRLILENLDKIKADFPECIIDLFFKNFDRILKNIEMKSFSSGFFLYPNDNFLKDLGVCSIRLIPAGSQKIDVTGLSRRFIFRKGIKQFFNSTMFYMFNIKGNTPFYQMHTDIHDRDLLADFNSNGTIAFYLRIAELLKKNTKIKGIFGSSWMNDPQLETISPVIYFGAKIVRENGGKLYYNGSTSEIISGATFASAKRTRLYKEGRYLPANYMLIWTRNDLLNWADRQENLDL